MGIVGVLPVVIGDRTILINPCKCKVLLDPLHLITVLPNGSLGVVVVVVDSSSISLHLSDF